MEDMRISIIGKKGLGGFAIDIEDLERILRWSGSQLEKAKQAEGRLPPSEAKTLKAIRDMQFWLLQL